MAWFRGWATGQVGPGCVWPAGWARLPEDIKHSDKTSRGHKHLPVVSSQDNQVNRAGIIQGGSCLPLPVLRTSPGTTAAAILLHGKQKQKQKQKEDWGDWRLWKTSFKLQFQCWIIKAWHSMGSNHYMFKIPRAARRVHSKLGIWPWVLREDSLVFSIICAVGLRD